MLTKHHLVVSAVVGAAVAFAFPASVPWWALTVYAAFLGTAIDLDHFVVARLYSGTWAPLGRVLRDPRLILLGQDRIFETSDLWALQRLLSHAVVAGVLVAALFGVSVYLAAFSGLVLYVHVLCDLLWDNWWLEESFEAHAAYLAERDD